MWMGTIFKYEFVKEARKRRRAFSIDSLATVRQPKYEMGKLAADILLDSIIKPTKEAKKHILEPKLIVRTSSCRLGEGKKLP